MPRISVFWLLAATACSFKADYTGGHFACTDGVCPANLVCNPKKQCIDPTMIDAGPDDAPIDARQAALTCADPGILPAAGGVVSGATIATRSTVASACGGFVMNGPDAIYKVTTLAGKHLLVDVSGGRKAYVIAACLPTPNTPACLQNTLATMSNPLSIASTAAGPQFIVVDDENAVATGPYTLTVTVN